MAPCSGPTFRSSRCFSTAGPNGEGVDDINGRAASECYLDLNWHARRSPKVRWSSYNRQLQIYQGELIEKDVYVRKFMELRKRDAGYDFSKIEVVLD